jgi:molybdopterin molybdotransferase
MIPFTEAVRILLEEIAPMEPERVILDAAPGRCLAEDLVAEADMPRFDNSSVDGYGVAVADVASASEGNPVCLKVAGVVAAGTPWPGELPPRAALRIMTGAPVPAGVEAVVMREYALEGHGDPSVVHLTRGAQPGENIRPRGGEVFAGARLLSLGTRVTPPVAALLAGAGRTHVQVHALPRVRVLITGSELAPPGAPLAPGRIYDSNGAGLKSAVKSLGISDVAVAYCEDDAAKTRAALETALRDADVVVTAGGVSVGDFDFVPGAFESLGGVRRFWKVAMKPGKPNYFGCWDRPGGGRALFFGLPGNPVGALLSFERLVRPALLALMGCRQAPPRAFPARLKAGLEKHAGRLEWVRGILGARDGRPEVEPIEKRESHMLSGLAQADCLIAFPAQAERLEEGAAVEVHLLEW